MCCSIPPNYSRFHAVLNIAKSASNAPSKPTSLKIGYLALCFLFFLSCTTHSKSSSQTEFRSHSIDRAAKQEICSRACKKASSCSILIGKSSPSPRTPAFSDPECTSRCNSSNTPVLAAAYDDVPAKAIPILGDCLKLDECTAFWACASQSGTGSQLAFPQSGSIECTELCGRLHQCLSDCDPNSEECPKEAGHHPDDAQLRKDQCLQECSGQSDQIAAQQMAMPRKMPGIGCMSLPSCEPFLDCVETSAGENSDLSNTPAANSQIPGVAQVCIDICQRAESCAPKNGILQGYSIADPVDASTEEWVECAVQCQQNLQHSSASNHGKPWNPDIDKKRERKMVECLASEDCSDFQQCVEKL